MLAKSKLENLCRELQRHNKLVKVREDIINQAEEGKREVGGMEWEKGRERGVGMREREKRGIEGRGMKEPRGVWDGGGERMREIGRDGWKWWERSQEWEVRKHQVVVT